MSRYCFNWQSPLAIMLEKAHMAEMLIPNSLLIFEQCARQLHLLHGRSLRR
jgi:hypothetical protein